MSTSTTTDRGAASDPPDGTSTMHDGTEDSNGSHVDPAGGTVLIVGTLGGGGIHRYIEDQEAHLGRLFDVSVYDMISNPRGSGAAWVLRSVLLGLLAALRFPFRSPPDVVHVHTSHRFSFYRASFYVLFAAYVWRRPVVVHVHGSSFDEFLGTSSTVVSRLQSVVLDAADEVVVLSPFWRDVLATATDPAKIRVVPNAVAPELYEPSFAPAVPHVVFVSNLLERKGVVEFAEAVEGLLDETDRDVRVTIAGKGRLSEHVERLADAHENVTYLGYVSEERKRSLVDEGSIFVLPTYAEGLPIAMLEGMAGGNAIVSTTVGSIPEVIGEDRGILIDPVDVDQLTAALVALVEDPDRVERMGRANRRAVVETYSWEVATETLATIYERQGAAGSRSTAAPTT